MGPFLNSYGVMGVFFNYEHPPVNRISQETLHDLEQEHSVEDAICNSHCSQSSRVSCNHRWHFQKPA
jgi:hypothetical protein